MKQTVDVDGGIGLERRRRLKEGRENQMRKVWLSSSVAVFLEFHARSRLVCTSTPHSDLQARNVPYPLPYACPAMGYTAPCSLPTRGYHHRPSHSKINPRHARTDLVL